MRKWMALSGLAVIAVLVVIQFVPVTTANPPIESDIPSAPEVKAILRRACYDCHSNETVWPWYSQIAPMSWIIAIDVQEGACRAQLLNMGSVQHPATGEEAEGKLGRSRRG